MLIRIDRVMLRVPNVEAAIKFYREVMGLKLLAQQKGAGGAAALRFAQGEGELVLHQDQDQPSGEVYYLVENVRELFEKRSQLKLQFLRPPQAGARGYKANIRDPFGNVLTIVDRSSEAGGKVVEDGKTPGGLFAGVAPKVAVKRDELIRAYQQIGRTADDLPYTAEFTKLHMAYSAHFADAKPSEQETWRQLLNLRKAGKLPKLGEARSKAPEIEEHERDLLRKLVGEDIGKRDRLPYSEKFDKLVDEFNQARPRLRNLSPHLVWRLVATLAK